MDKEKEIQIENENEVEIEVEESNALEKEIETLKAEVNHLKNEYARAYADTENTRRRLTQEAELNRKYRIQSFALEILPVIDNLERALAQEVESEEAANYRKGVEMIYAQLVNALKNEGVEEIDVLNKPFDANVAQAIILESVEGVEPGVVTAVLQKGYKLKDRILRASMVKVSE